MEEYYRNSRFKMGTTRYSLDNKVVTMLPFLVFKEPTIVVQLFREA